MTHRKNIPNLPTILTIIIILTTYTPPPTLAQTPTPLQPFTQSDLKILTGDVQRPNGLYWHDNKLFTACAGDWTVYSIDPINGYTDTYAFGIKNANMIYVEDNSIIWAADFQSNQIAHISKETGLTIIKEGLTQPWGITPSFTNDYFYITQWGSDDLIKMTREGKTSIIASNFNDPSGIIATENILYIANNGSAARAVEWLNLTDPDIKAHPLISGLQKVTNLALAPDGYLYAAYALGTRGVVGRIDPIRCRQNGGCTTTQVELILWTDLPAPLAGLTFSSDMRLFIHAAFGTEIYWIDIPYEKNSR